MPSPQAGAMKWRKITAGIYEAQHDGRTYQVAYHVSYRPDTASVWMLSVDYRRPDDFFFTRREAQAAAAELAGSAS